MTSPPYATIDPAIRWFPADEALWTTSFEKLLPPLASWENRSAGDPDIVINCTPVGLHPNVDESPFPSNALREGTLVFDTAYNPENTLLIKQAKERACLTVSGVEMFVRQAARQFELFTGHPGPVDLMRNVVRRAISPIGGMLK